VTEPAYRLADGADLVSDGNAPALLVDGAAGRAVALNEVGAQIAHRIVVPDTLDGVCEALTAEWDVDPDACRAEVEAFVGRLGEQGFVEHDHAPGGETAMRRRYLDLLQRALVNLIYPEHQLWLEHVEEHGTDADTHDHQRRLRDLRYAEPGRFAAYAATKLDGRNWNRRVTRDAHTMIGLRRLANLERCAASVFRNGVEGDFLEAGVWRGGGAVFLRALQVAYGHGDRRTWVADSFAGLPEPSTAVDLEHRMHLTEDLYPWLSSPLHEVQDTFRTYGLLSDRVRFLPGWFADTLPDAPVEHLAVLRIDGDLYSSTREALEALYDRVSPGGYVIVDDYGAFPACATAVDEFLEQRGEGIVPRRIDWTGVFWQKAG
jgi:O-methyltransferase